MTTESAPHCPTCTCKPRVWCSGEPEPGPNVRAVLDTNGWLWKRSYAPNKWYQESQVNSDYPGASDHLTWVETLEEGGPLVEVVLPKPVSE